MSAAAAGSQISAVQAPGQMTVYELFRAQVRRDASLLAIEEKEKRVAYGELDQRVRRLASALTGLGIRRGDRIAMLSENRSEYVELELAAARIGAIVACQNWRLVPSELQHCLDLVTPRLILVSARYAPTLAKLKTADSKVIEIERDYEALIANTKDDGATYEVSPEDGLVILYTSGTTGLPKGALVSHRAEIARMAVLRMDLNVTREDGFAAWAPMFHMGSTDQMLAALMSGAPVIVIDGFNAQAIVDTMARYKLGWLLLMPGSIEPVVALLQQQRTVAKGIKAIGAMADLVPTKLIAELSGLTGAPYLNSFGSTETGLPPGTGVLFQPGVVPTSLSKRMSSLCDMRLVDSDWNEVTDGDPGEIAIRGPTVFSGYWNAPEVNAKDFRDGWFRMGDLFRRNSDGSYDFVDRAKYMIKSGGENIYPAEIERVLLADPRVADAVVVRKKDEKWGEVPVAFVAAHDAAMTEADVETICRRDLASYKRPRQVHFVGFDELPRSTTGKIQRHEVEKKWLSA
jgi:acyl-CoA synthetase (AMP-forming)/AMP-acid ligase II